MYGPERAGNDSDPRTLFDAVAILKAHDRLTLGVNLDWGTDKNGAGSARNRSDARWTGIAGYARISATRALALSLRVESFEDRAGVRTGVVQTLSEFTATPEYRFTPHLLVRGDVRVDRSDRPVFEKSQALTKTQPTVLLNACYSF
jgi:hypothetical protein